jgi:hypothetical protein
MRIFRTLLVASSLAGALFAFAACGGDDNNNNNNGTTDAGGDAKISTTDGGMKDGNAPLDGNAPDSNVPAVDGGDAGCDFATFVINLIDNDTTNAAQPSTDLGQNCTDQQLQSQYAPLFP